MGAFILLEENSFSFWHLSEGEIDTGQIIGRTLMYGVGWRWIPLGTMEGALLFGFSTRPCFSPLVPPLASRYPSSLESFIAWYTNTTIHVEVQARAENELSNQSGFKSIPRRDGRLHLSFSH